MDAETIRSVLIGIAHPVGAQYRTTCPLHRGSNPSEFRYSGHGFFCYSCGAKGHVGTLKKALGLPVRTARVKPPAKIAPLYPDGYTIHGWNLDWLLGPLKAGILTQLLHRGLDGAPVEWGHRFARLKVPRGGRTTIVATRALGEALGLITVTPHRGRQVAAAHGRMRRKGDVAVVHPDALFRLGIFAQRWKTELGTTADGSQRRPPLTVMHAWILLVWRIARDGAEEAIPRPPDAADLPFEFWAELADLITHAARYVAVAEPVHSTELPSDLLRRSYSVAVFRHPPLPAEPPIRRRTPRGRIEGDCSRPWRPPDAVRLSA